MNRIYKVVWSKVKHCYVVTSELAKRQTKGCGTRSLRMATVSLGVAAALLYTGGAHGLISPSVAEAARHEITTDTSISSDETSTYADGVKMNASNIALTITSTGKVKMIESAGYNNNTITVQGKVICGSSSSSAIWGAATGTKVYIKTGANVQGEIYAGRDDTSEVSGNKLDISSGTIEGNIFGGVNNNITAYDVKNNAITISGSSITGSVIGGTTLSGKASLNTVNISGDATAITGEVVGGRSANSDATENKVIINGGNFDKSVIGGNTTNGKNATDNKVTIEGGTIAGSIYGGWSQNGTGTANSNEVHISKGSVTGDVYGGAIKENVTGEIKGNMVEITGGTINAGKAVYGGYSIYNSVGGTGEGEGNKVVISDDAQVNSTVVGGFSSTKEAIGNSVEISGGEATSTVYGGYSVKDAVTGNRVVITGGKAGVNAESASYIIGGYSASSGAATDNKVTISDGTAGESRNVYIYGGSSVSGAADTNEVNLNGGKIGKFSYVSYIYGGVGNTSASGNTVNITGGAFENGSLYGGYSSTGTADTNIISMTGGTLSYTSIHGGRGGASASGNEVTVSGGLAGYVYGGAATYNTGKMNQNKVTVTGEETVVSGVIGGQDGVENNDNTVLIEDGSTVKVDVYGGYSTGAGSAINNKVTVTDSTVNGNVFGGVSFRGAEAVTKNAVTINNSTIGKNVYGGRQYDNESGTAFSVTGNIVTINGGTFAADKQMYGGFTYSGTTTDNIINLTGTTTGLEGVEIYGGSQSANTGNELHVGGTKTYDTSGNFVTNSGDVWQGSSNNTVKKVANFEKIVLHSVKWDATVAALEATTVNNVKTLDIKDINFDQIPSSGSMGLLKSGSDLSAIKLDHATGSGIAITTTGVDLAPADMTETTGVNGVKLAQSVTGKVLLAADNKAINYSVAASEIKGVTFGEVTFAKNGIARDLSNRTFAATNTVDAADLTFVATNQVIAVNDSMKLVVNATNLTTTVANNTGKTVAVTGYEDAQKIKYNATASGTVTSDGSAVLYTVDSVTLSSVDLGNWSGTTSVVPESWSIADGATIKTDGMTAPTIDPGNHIDILQSNTDKYFAAATITGANVYKETSFKEEEKGIALAGVQSKGVTLNAEKNHLIYMVGKKNVNTVTLGSVNWQKDAVLLDGSSATEYDYAAITTIGTDAFDVTYAAPETVAAGESMTLLKANETLTAIINEEKAKAYSFSPVSGVTVDAAINGKLTNSNNNVVFTAAANQASKLTFGDVEWKDSGALLTRPSNITFAGADVDTSKINFTNMIYLDADRQMTLVSDFGDKVGTVTGSKYLVGTAFEGEGAASLSGKDLIFRTKTGAGVSEQTHKTVMATEVGVTMLNTGNDYIDKAMEGMGDLANVAPDGTTVGAAIGGGRNRYETGSHVNVNSWNAAVAVGAKRELKNGSLEYGVFGEYGKANFTLHSDAGKGDGDSHL